MLFVNYCFCPYNETSSPTNQSITDISPAPAPPRCRVSPPCLRVRSDAVPRPELRKLRRGQRHHDAAAARHRLRAPPARRAQGQRPDGAREGGAQQQGLALPPVHPHLLHQGQPQEPHPVRAAQVLHREALRVSVLRPQLRHQAEPPGEQRASLGQMASPLQLLLWTLTLCLIQFNCP